MVRTSNGKASKKSIKRKSKKQKSKISPKNTTSKQNPTSSSKNLKQQTLAQSATRKSNREKSPIESPENSENETHDYKNSEVSESEESHKEIASSPSKTVNLKDITMKLPTDEILKRFKLLLQTLQEIETGQPVLHLESFRKKLLNNQFMNHRQLDIQLYTACCLSDFLRLDSSSFTKTELKKTLQCFVDQLIGLENVGKSQYERSLYLLRNVYEIKAFNLCIPNDFPDVIINLFEKCFQVISPKHDDALIERLGSILVSLLFELEYLETEVLEIILKYISEREEKSNSSHYKLAKLVLEADSLALQAATNEYYGQKFENPMKTSQLSATLESISKIYHISPRSLLYLIPNLISQLQTDNVQDRILMTKHICVMLANSNMSKQIPNSLESVLKRAVDVDVNVRIILVQSLKNILVHQSHTRKEILAVLNERLLDPDERVRVESVKCICEALIEAETENTIYDDILTGVGKRLQDKKLSVRKVAIKNLAHIYFDRVAMKDLYFGVNRFDWISISIMRCWYQKDPQISDQIIDVLLEKIICIDNKNTSRNTLLLLDQLALDDTSFRVFLKIIKKSDTCSKLLTEEVLLSFLEKAFATEDAKEMSNYSNVCLGIFRNVPKVITSQKICNLLISTLESDDCEVEKVTLSLQLFSIGGSELPAANEKVDLDFDKLNELLNTFIGEGSTLQSKYAISALNSLFPESLESLVKGLSKSLSKNPSNIFVLSSINQLIKSVKAVGSDKKRLEKDLLEILEANEVSTKKLKSFANISNDCKAKSYCLKILVNFADEKSFIAILTSFMDNPVTHICEQSRLRLVAGSCLLRLAARKENRNSASIAEKLLTLSKFMEDPCLSVRDKFVIKLYKALSISTPALHHAFSSLFVLSAVYPNANNSIRLFCGYVSQLRSLSTSGDNREGKKLLRAEHILPYAIHLIARQQYENMPKYLEFLFTAFLDVQDEDHVSYVYSLLMKVSEKFENYKSLCILANDLAGKRAVRSNPIWPPVPFPGEISLPSNLFDDKLVIQEGKMKVEEKSVLQEKEIDENIKRTSRSSSPTKKPKKSAKKSSTVNKRNASEVLEISPKRRNASRATKANVNYSNSDNENEFDI